MKTHKPAITRIWYDEARDGYFIRVDHKFHPQDTSTPRRVPGGPISRDLSQVTHKVHYLFHKGIDFWDLPLWDKIKGEHVFWQHQFPEGLVAEVGKIALKLGFRSRYQLLRHVKANEVIEVSLVAPIEEPPLPTLYDHIEDES